MSTTTYLASGARAPGAVVPHGARRRLRGRPVSVAAAVRRPSGTSSPFGQVVADDVRHGWRRVVVSTLVTLAWVPVLVLTLAAFALVGVVAGVTTTTVWLWRTVSPARPAAAAVVESLPAFSSNTLEAVLVTGPPHVVRDRTFGYDA